MSAVLQLQNGDLPYNQFNQFVADNVGHNLVTLDCLHIPSNVFLLHMLHWVGPQSGDSYAELWKWMTYKQLATTTVANV